MLLAANNASHPKEIFELVKMDIAMAAVGDIMSYRIALRLHPRLRGIALHCACIVFATRTTPFSMPTGTPKYEFRRNQEEKGTKRIDPTGKLGRENRK